MNNLLFKKKKIGFYQKKKSIIMANSLGSIETGLAAGVPYKIQRARCGAECRKCDRLVDLRLCKKAACSKRGYTGHFGFTQNKQPTY